MAYLPKIFEFLFIERYGHRVQHEMWPEAIHKVKHGDFADDKSKVQKELNYYYCFIENTVNE